jgi:tetratricopeptide (TPR) repeat protein
MIDSEADGSEAVGSKGENPWIQRGILAGMCVLVLGLYVYTAHPGYVVSLSLNPGDAYYNLLVQGFRAGQLNLKTDVPRGLAQLADPYDPVAHAAYPVGDMSYYKGKLYFYYGATPAVVLFWPQVVLTGHYLPQKDAAVIFCFVGFLVSVGLLRVLWRRYFPQVGITVVAAGALALGLATGVPMILARCDFYDVSISCGYALTMLSVAAIWKALNDSSHRGQWVAAASLAYGLAVGARPTLLFGAVILLVPVVRAWRERRKVWAVLLASAGPIAIIGLGLMAYNLLRFDNPFEFGYRYQLAGDRQLTLQVFSPRYLWYNLRVYFLAAARWSGRFPFVQDATAPAMPAGHGQPEQTFGVLTNIPLVWLALAAPLAWRNRSGGARTILRGLLAAMVVLFGFGALTLGFCCYSVGRYEVDFLPALMLLAVIGILSLERSLAPTSESGQAGPAQRRMLGWAMRWGWSLLLAFSVAFNLLTSVGRCALADNNLGMALQQAGQTHAAIGPYEQAIRLKPDYAGAHNRLGIALFQVGRLSEAIGHWEQAVQLEPDFAEAHNNLSVAMVRQGRLQEAIEHWEQALRLKPVYLEAHYDLAVALEKAGRVEEAIGHWEQALRLKPDFAEAHYDLAAALRRQGRVQEAIGHYEQALRIQPDYFQAQCGLANTLLEAGRAQEAIGHYEQALRISPGSAELHLDFGLALEETGRSEEAIGQYEQALRIKPDLVQAQKALARARAGKGR